MCGRTAVLSTFEECASALDIPPNQWRGKRKSGDGGGNGGGSGDSIGNKEYRPSGNVCPGKNTPVCYLDEESGNVCLRTMKWGLIPSSSYTNRIERPDYFKMFNARSETADVKPVFSRILQRGRRCVVPVDGYFEWKQEGKKKQPYFVYRKKEKENSSSSSSSEEEGEGERGGREREKRKRGLLLLAGLYDIWTNQLGEEEFTYTIFTTKPCKQIEWLHDRQPVFLEDKEEWLLTKHGGMALRAPSSNANVSLALSWHPVTQEVGNVSYDKPDSVLDIRQVKGSISSLMRKQRSPSSSPQETPVGLKLESFEDKVKMKKMKMVTRINNETKGAAGSSLSLQTHKKTIKKKDTKQKSIKAFFANQPM